MKEKILITLPNLKCGGTERTAAELANYITTVGGQVIILLLYKEKKFYSLNKEVKVIEPFFTKQKLGKYFYILRVLYYIRTQLKKQKPDVVFALGYISLLLVASVGLKTKVIVSFRSSPTRVRFPRNKLLNHTYIVIKDLMRRRINGIISQTNYTAQMFIKKYSCPIVTIPNFLRELKIYNQHRLDQIITVGHCSFEKGQHYLLEAFSMLNALTWKLVIVGDGPLKKNLEKMAIKLGIEDRVLFTGYQEDVDIYLSQSKIFALTSIIEGYPNALIEAMATPLPVVSFNCIAGPADIIIDGENGYLVNVGDTKALVSKLQELIDDPVLRTRIESKAYEVRQRNNLNRIAEQYINFFKEVL